MDIDFYVSGHQEAGKRLDDMGQRATHAREAFEEIMDSLITGERTLWQRKTGWAKLAVSTKKRADRNPGLMVESGDLMRSLTVPYAPHQVRVIHEELMRFGSSVKYARYHQYARGKGKRPVLKVTPKTRRSIRDLILEHLVG